MPVLLVEDEYFIRLILAEELMQAGFQVVEAESGIKATEFLRTTPGFSLLITDIHMPGKIDGLEVARLARERHSEVPIIYMTGRPEVPVASIVLGSREALIIKPFLPSELIKLAGRLTQS